MQPSFIIVSSPSSSNSSRLSSDQQMALDDSRINTGLGLGLTSLEEETPLNIKINNNSHGSKKHKMMMMMKKASSSSSTLLVSFEPCLTLGLFSSGSEEYAVNNNSSNSEENNSSDVNYNRQGSDSDPPHSISTVSSLSNNNNNNVSINIKRERAADHHGSIDQEMEASRVNDEDCSNIIRKKLRLTKEQSSLLEESFKQHSTLHPNQKQALASQLNLQPRQVEVWFQNRRARTKLKQTEVDCEFLKKCCETLTDENRRLQKEIQELKAIKASQQQPFFMQLPAATLTICPSCERRGRNGSVVTTADGSPKKSFSMAASNNIKPLYCNPFTNPSAAC